MKEAMRKHTDLVETEQEHG